MRQGRDESGRFDETVTDQEILEVFDYEDDPILTASEVADGLGRFGKQITPEGVRNRLGRMAEEGLVGRKEVGARAIAWWAEVAPALDDATATTIDARRDSDEWVELSCWMATVLLHPDVEKHVESLPNDVEGRVRTKLADAGEDPERHLKRLKGREEYSLRIGKRRVIVDWDSDRDELRVLAVDTRDTVNG